MARKPDIQYISQFYVPGSEAQVIEFKPAKPQKQQRKVNVTAPKAVPQQKIVLRVDPAAVCGLLVAAVMLICMAVGMIQYLNVCAEHRIMSDKVIMLQNENVTLREKYHAGYDVEEITRMAEAMGMVQREALQTVSVKVKIPTPAAEPTWWENVQWFCEGLFA